MAINVDISKITGINQVGNSYQRKSAVPLDYYSLFNTKAEAEAYAQSNPVSYVGQVISYIDNGKVEVCVIENEAGALKKVGTAPLGDGKTIEVSAAGAVALLGSATAAAGTLPMLEEVEVEGGEKVTKLVWKTLEQIGAGDGNDNTTYVFSWSADNQQLTITTKENGVAQENPQVIDLSAFVTATELATELAPYAKTADVVAASAFETFKTENTEAIAAAKSGAEKTASDALAAARTEITAEIGASATTLQGNIDKKVDTETYNTDKKALQDEDKAIREIAEGVRDAFNTFMNSEEIDETVNTLKEVQAEIAKMTDATELETALAAKADKTYAEGLEDRIEVLEGKPFDTYATKSEVEGVDGKFANYTTTADLTTLLAGKQDTIPAETYDAFGAAATAKSEAIEAAASDASTKAATAKSEAIADAATKYYGKGETYTKDEIDDLLEGIQGGASESAASVNAKLESYKKVVNAEVWGDEAGAGVDGNSRIDILDSKVKALEEVGSQANVIESVVGATDNRLSVTTSGKTVTIDDANLRTDIADAKKAGTDAAQTASEAVAAASANASAIQKNAGDIANLQTTVGTHTEDIAGLKAHDSEHTAQYNALNTSVTEHGTKIANLETGKADKSVVEEVSGKATANEQAIKTLNETTIPAINGEIAKKANSEDVYDKDAIDGLIEELEGKITDAEYDDTAIKALIQGNTDAITDITKDGGAIATAVAAEAAIARAAEKKNADDIAAINALLNTVDSEDNITSLKELASWVEEHGSEASEMAKSITANTEAIAAINNAESGILVQAKAHSDANLATAKKYADDAIAALLVKNVDNKTLQLDENGVASVKAISTDLLVQGETELVFCAGDAAGYHTTH